MDGLLSNTGLPNVSLQPTYGFPLQTPTNNGARNRDLSTSPTATTSAAKGTRKRKLPSFGESGQSPESGEDDEEGDGSLQRNGSSRKSRPSGTKRACNQCRQQKVSERYPIAVYVIVMYLFPYHRPELFNPQNTDIGPAEM
jgi:hypothetical protein